MSLTLQDLRLAHAGVAHLDGISAEFGRGRLTAVIGRTLSGKTTLMRTIAGLQGADSGDIQLDGRPFTALPAWKRDVAMVYQQFINYPHLSVFDNIAFPLRKQKVAQAEVNARVGAALETVGLAGFRDRRPTELSGGQQQRVALARALVRKAGILLLDEPLVNLDYKLREQLREEFRGLLSSQSEAIVIYNTTEPAEAMMLGDQIIVLHEGRVLQVGAPEDVFSRPASALVAAVVNDPPMNIIAGAIDEAGLRMSGGVVTQIPSHLQSLPAGQYRFGIRANELEISPNAPLSGIVTFSEVSGSETFIYLDTAFGEAVLQLEGVHVVANGATVPLGIPTACLFCFAPDGDGVLLASPHRMGEQ